MFHPWLELFRAGAGFGDSKEEMGHGWNTDETRIKANHRIEIRVQSVFNPWLELFPTGGGFGGGP
jgi:hypothetical protein